MGAPKSHAADDAAKAEAERQAQIKASTAQIAAIFDNPARTAQYGQLANDTTGFYTNDLNRQKTTNDLQTKFMLARQGLTGGSVQADDATKAGQDYLRGIVEASRRGQAASAALRGQDETSRANLTALAQSGLDTTTASANSASALRSNLAGANANATSGGLGDAFGDFANIYKQSQNQADNTRGYKYGFGSLYAPIAAPGAGGGSVPYTSNWHW